MEIKNLTGLEKPLIKLVETVSEGIGVVGNHIFEFDTTKLKRIGRTEAENEKNKIIAHAEAQEKAIEILGRAEKRFALEQYNKQINLENILVKTKEDLKGKKVSEEPVEKDWATRFIGVAKDVSKEELQNILAKILSGEIQNPGSYSMKTLEIIKNLSKADLEKFQKFVAISSHDGFIIFSDISKADFLRKYDLDFTDYVKLSDLGLFNQSSSLAVYFDIKYAIPAMINIGKKILWISVLENEEKRLNLRTLVFSNAGQEIFPLLLENSRNNKSLEYINDLKNYVERQGFKISEGQK